MSGALTQQPVLVDGLLLVVDVGLAVRVDRSVARAVEGQGKAVKGSGSNERQ